MCKHLPLQNVTAWDSTRWHSTRWQRVYVCCSNCCHAVPQMLAFSLYISAGQVCVLFTMTHNLCAMRAIDTELPLSTHHLSDTAWNGVYIGLCIFDAFNHICWLGSFCKISRRCMKVVVKETNSRWCSAEVIPSRILLFTWTKPNYMDWHLFFCCYHKMAMVLLICWEMYLCLQWGQVHAPRFFDTRSCRNFNALITACLHFRSIIYYLRNRITLFLVISWCGLSLLLYSLALVCIQLCGRAPYWRSDYRTVVSVLNDIQLPVVATCRWVVTGT